SRRTDFPLIEDVRDFHRRPAGCRLTERPSPEPNRARPQCFDKLLLDLVAAPEVKFFRLFVVLVDGSSCRASQLDSVRGDARQNGLKVESRTYRLTDFAEGFELAHRACQFGGSLIQFFKQPDIFDGDHRLAAKVSSSLTCLSEKGRTSVRLMLITPIGAPSLSIGSRRHVRTPKRRPWVSGNSVLTTS